MAGEMVKPIPNTKQHELHSLKMHTARSLIYVEDTGAFFERSLHGALRFDFDKLSECEAQHVLSFFQRR